MARCAFHGDFDAVGICARCGVFCCVQCMGAGETCSACAARVQGPPSALAVATGILGTAGLTCGFVPGIVAIVLARIELRRIARGSASATGIPWARGGMILGSVSLVLAVFLALSWWT
jgi:hypothetical protein